MYILIYADKGTDSDSVAQTVSMFQSIVSGRHYIIKLVSACDVSRDNWGASTSLLVVPGGASRFYQEALKGAGNDIIRNFVLNGGSYLGICAGAYYASDEVRFAAGTKLEACGKRDLGFFHGISLGPYLADFSYDCRIGARAAKLRLTNVAGMIKPDNKSNRIYVYYDGGGTFIPHESCNDADKNANRTSVIAYYEDKDGGVYPAIIKILIGRGVAVLSGVHFEYEFTQQYTDLYLQRIVPKIQSCVAGRLMLKRAILKDLGVCCHG